MMERTNIIGMDWGGSKSDIMVSDTELNIFYTGKYMGINVQRESPMAIRALFDEIVSDLKKRLKLSPEDIKVVVIGAAGAGREFSKKKIKDAFTASRLSSSVYIFSDMQIAYKSVFFKENGILINAGTGSFAYCIDAEGREVRTGGWGHLIGDEGSGFYIGREGIAAALKSYDGRAGKSSLKNALCSRFSLKSIEEIVPLIYSGSIGIGEIAESAELVFKAAQKNDAAAQNILEKAADELVLHIDALRRNFPGDSKKIRVALTGGVFNNNKEFGELIKDKVKGDKVMGDIEISDKKCQPVRGAVMCGVELLNAGIPEESVRNFLMAQ